MLPLFVTIGAVIALLAGGIWLAQIIREPQADYPPRWVIGRVLMPVSEIMFGISMLIGSYTAQTALLPAVASIFAVTALILQLRYRPR
jgi:hypothetical protein